MAGVVDNSAALRRGGPINGERVAFLIRHSIQGHAVFLPGLEGRQLCLAPFVDIDRVLKWRNCVISLGSQVRDLLRAFRKNREELNTQSVLGLQAAAWLCGCPSNWLIG